MAIHTPYRILIRADATSTMGTGHVMRCLALASAAQQAGLLPLLAGYIDVPWVRQRLEQEDIQYVNLPISFCTENPYQFFDEIVKEYAPDCLALDGYHFTHAWHLSAIKAGQRLLIVDDYGHLSEYQAHILLNQNIGAENISYKGSCKNFLLGPKYSLLRPEFVAARRRITDKPFSDKVKKILINLGGGDFSYFLPAIASAIHSTDSSADINILAGSMPIQTIHKVFADFTMDVKILRNIRDMPGLFLDVDLCISAAGSTCWELCCLGVPFITVVLAENQLSVAQKLADAGVAPQLSQESLDFFLTCGTARARAAEAGMALVDGRGAERVISFLQTM